MDLAVRFSKAVDGFTGRLGRGLPWLVLAITLLGAGNALARYLGRQLGRSLTSNALLEAQWYLFSALFLLGAAVMLKQDGHVRVDVLHARVSRRVKDWIDLVGTLVFLLPFSLFGLAISWPMVARSLVDREMSPDPGGLPRFPVKALLLFGFALLLLQGLSELVKKIQALRVGVPGQGGE